MFGGIDAGLKTIRELLRGQGGERLRVGDALRRPVPATEISAGASGPKFGEIHVTNNKTVSEGGKNFFPNRGNCRAEAQKPKNEKTEGEAEFTQRFLTTDSQHNMEKRTRGANTDCKPGIGKTFDSRFSSVPSAPSVVKFFWFRFFAGAADARRKRALRARRFAVCRLSRVHEALTAAGRRLAAQLASSSKKSAAGTGGKIHPVIIYPFRSQRRFADL